MKTLVLIGALAAVAAPVRPVLAQVEPPVPVSQMLAGFAADPNGVYWSYLEQALRTCPLDPSSWQYQFMEGLFVLPFRGAIVGAVVPGVSYKVERCDDPLLNEWTRNLLDNPDAIGGYDLAIAASALGRSSSLLNHEAALRTLYDPRLDTSVRSWILARWVDGRPNLHAYALALLTEAYPESEGPPPSQLSLSILAVREREGYPVAREALRGLLDAVGRRPDTPAALQIMNSLLNDAAYLGPDDPWVIELGAVMQDYIAGRIPAPRALVTFIEEHEHYFCRGPDAAARNARCR